VPSHWRGDRFLLLVALANAGGVIAYVPYLMLLLPARMAELAAGARVEWLGVATLAGAVTASCANIAFGWASDIAGTRRGWMAAGLALTLASYVLLHGAATPSALVAAIVVYQAALNMMLSPLAAWAAERVPDARKGLLGGLLGAGQPVGTLAGVLVTLPLLPQQGQRLAAVCAMVLAFALPLLLLRAGGAAMSRPSAQATGGERGSARRPAMRADFALLWAARLLVQVAGNALFGFLVYYFMTLPSPPPEARIAQLSALAVALSFPIALACGHWSDRLRRRRPFQIAAACAAAGGLALMARNDSLASGAGGYALFACASGVFLALNTGFAMQLLPSPARRGRDLGMLNLANTLPAILAPLLAIWLVPGRGFGLLLAVLAGLTLLAGLCVALVRHDADNA